MLRVLILTALATPALAEAPVPRFTDETLGAGLDHRFTGEWEQMVGGGVGTFDCSGDGLPDMVLAGGTGPAAFYLNTATQGGPLRFARQTSGLEAEGVLATYPLDIDSDGLTDVVLLRQGENLVMRGLGECRFGRANEAWGFDGGDAWSAAFAATWERGADWPTLAIGNYIDRTEDAFPWGSCTDNWLHRGDANGFAPPLPLTPSHCALSMLFTDWNRSGTPSLRVSNDREYYKGGQEQLWHLPPGAPPALYTEAEGWQRLRIWGMGIASRDLNGDGFPEYFLTSMADNKLQTLKAGPESPAYADVAFATGVTAQRPYAGGEVKPSTAWHAQFEDVNNDGLADLFIAKGNVSEMPDFALMDPNNLLLQQPGGSFAEAGDRAGVASFRTARGAMLADFNLDGLLDLVVVNRNAGAELWRNVSEDAGRWVQVRLEQPGANRDGVGAWIELRAGGLRMSREITSGGGHASGHLGWWHFGLGDAESAEVRVIWPDGTEGAWERLPADGFHVLRRGATATPWQPNE